MPGKYTMYSYSSSRGVVELQRDLINEACDKAGTDDVNDALRKMGFMRQFEIGNPEIASIELFLSAGNTDHKALVHLTIGYEMHLYAIDSFHDVLEFMKEYVPTIKAMTELSEEHFR